MPPVTREYRTIHFVDMLLKINLKREMLGRDVTWIIREEERAIPEKRHEPPKEAADLRAMKLPDVVQLPDAEEKKPEERAAAA